MKIFRRILLFVMMAVLAMTALFACGGSGGGDSSVDEEGNIDMNKRIVIRFAAPEGEFGEEIKAFAAGFNKKYPNITIKYEPISGAWDEKLLGQLGSGTAPDVFWTDSIYKFASRNALEPLDDYFTKYNVDKNDYYESMMESGQYQGNQYMLPREYNHVVIFYNKKLFRDTFKDPNNLPFTPVEGTVYPANGWTWSEFVETSKAFVKKQDGNVVQRGADLSFSWGSSGPQILLGLGGKIANEDGMSIDFNNETNKKILQNLKDLIDMGAFVNNVKVDVGDIFSGRVAMVVNSRPATMDMENKFGDDWDVVSFPELPIPMVGTGSSGYVMNRASKVKEAAAQLLFYMISEEGQQIFMETGNCVPVLKSLRDSDVWRTMPRADINHEAFLYKPENDVLAYRFMLGTPSAVGNFETEWKNFVTAYLNGDKSVAEDLEYGQKQLSSIF